MPLLTVNVRVNVHYANPRLMLMDFTRNSKAGGSSVFYGNQVIQEDPEPESDCHLYLDIITCSSCWLNPRCEPLLQAWDSIQRRGFRFRDKVLMPYQIL